MVYRKATTARKQRAFEENWKKRPFIDCYHLTFLSPKRSVLDPSAELFVAEITSVRSGRKLMHKKKGSLCY